MNKELRRDVHNMSLGADSNIPVAKAKNKQNYLIKRRARELRIKLWEVRIFKKWREDKSGEGF